jgi:hypothetical protein
MRGFTDQSVWCLSGIPMRPIEEGLGSRVRGNVSEGRRVLAPGPITAATTTITTSASILNLNTQPQYSTSILNLNTQPRKLSLSSVSVSTVHFTGEHAGVCQGRLGSCSLVRVHLHPQGRHSTPSLTFLINHTDLTAIESPQWIQVKN